jgi:glycosyltransferase 2 family protein
VRRRLLAWVGIALSLVFAYLAFRDVEFDALGEALREQDYLYLLPAGAALAVGVLLRAWRWQLLFERGSRPAFAHVANALLVGYLFNTILPARAGEVVRVQVLGRRARTSRAHVLATVVLERSYDVVVLVLLLACATPFLPPVGWRTAALALGGVLVAGLIAVAVIARRYQSVATALLRLLARLPFLGPDRVERAGGNFMRGLVSLRSSRLALAALAVTVASWLALALSTWFLLLGTRIEEGFGAALLVIVATNLILVLPSSPAALGAFEAAAVLALSAYGVGRELALSFALVLHALNAFPYLPLGYAALVLHGRALKRR